jgi:hypothetical protein
MFENSKQNLASRKKFTARIWIAVFIYLGLMFISLMIGIFGYHYLGSLGWVDSFYNASMILGGMGPVDLLSNNPAKIFAGVYSIFCGAVFLLAIGIVAAPVFHRFMHKFHLEK